MGKKLITKKVYEKLGISRSKFYRRLAEGMPYTLSKDGKKKFDLDEVQLWLSENERRREERRKTSEDINSMYIEEFMEIEGVSRVTIYRWTKKGLPYTKKNGRVSFNKLAAADWLSKNEHKRKEIGKISKGINFMYIEELTSDLGVSRITVYRWTKQGLPYTKKKGRVYFNKLEVVEWLSKNRKQINIEELRKRLNL